MILFSVPVVTKAADIKVTNSKGETFILKEMQIEYGNGITLTEGIYVEKAGGELRLSWQNIRTVQFSEPNCAKITMADGKEHKFTLLRKLSQFSGDTDLGSFSIPFENVKTLEVIRP